MPEPLRKLDAVAASLPIENVDTDMIWPGSTGGSIRKGEQAGHAFYHMRFAPDGSERAEFVLNQAPWRHAKILIGGDNFGCGSSRELAVWALHDWGLRCIIAPRFGDIFYSNCCLNGLLPIRLPREAVDRLAAFAADPETALMAVDLEACTVAAQGELFHFEMEARPREALLNGYDAITQTLSDIDDIRAFGRAYGKNFPWIADIDSRSWGTSA